MMTAPNRDTVLVFEECVGDLAGAALALVRSGIHAVYAADVNEARLMAAEYANRIVATVFPGTIEQGRLALVLGGLEIIPVMIAAGEDPGGAPRRELSDAGVSWGIWGAESHARLRVAVSVALDLSAVVPAGAPFAIANLTARLRCAEPETEAEADGQGLVHILSPRGVFIETAAEFRPGAMMDLDVMVSGPLSKLHGCVTMCNRRDAGYTPRWPVGVGVLLEGISPEAEQAAIQFILADRAAFSIA